MGARMTFLRTKKKKLTGFIHNTGTDLTEANLVHYRFCSTSAWQSSFEIWLYVKALPLLKGAKIFPPNYHSYRRRLPTR